MEDSSSESRYDIFEVELGHPVWLTQVLGILFAGLKLRELSDKICNECFARHVASKNVVARLNTGPFTNHDVPHVFHIAYDLKMADALAEELPFHGYRFGYGAGNDLASAILSASVEMDCDVLILGCGAPEEVRRDMAAWLRANCPGVPIIALKSPFEQDLATADYNLELDGDRALLPTIAQAMNKRRSGTYE
jgi:hypothetical protein